MVDIILIGPTDIEHLSAIIISNCEISNDFQDIQTALMAASHGGHVKIVTLLHGAKADINFPDHVSHSS